MNVSDSVLREQLVKLLDGRQAHLTFDDAVADFPPEAINKKPPNVPYTPWQLVEHLRIAQWDILEFVRDPDHVSPQWPDGYWPARSAQADMEQWKQSVARFRADLQSLRDLVQDPTNDLTAPLAHAPDYTLLREILVVADHNAYHIGELAILRQVMEAWPTTRNE